MNLDELERLQREISRLDANGEERESRRVGSKFYRLLREFEVFATKRLVKLALQYKAAIVIDRPQWKSLKALKEDSDLGAKKQFLNIGRLLRRLRHLAEWYGIPYGEERLYSTVCPKCGAKMEELNGRRVLCPQCGFVEERDRVPILWARKKHAEITSKLQTPSFPSPISIARQLSA